MRYSIRNRFNDPIRGAVVKVEHINGELGSGRFDINDREIFEGDIVRYNDHDCPVKFSNGSLTVGGVNLSAFNDGTLEIVGHVEEVES